MSWTPEEAGALDAVDRILNRGGDAQDVVRAIVAALTQRGFRARLDGGVLELAGTRAEFAARMKTLVSYEAARAARRDGGPSTSEAPLPS